MALHAFVFLLVVCLLLSLARLGRLGWFPLRLSSSRGGVKRTTLQRLRHRPAPRTIAPPVISPPLPRRVQGQLLLLYAPGARRKAGEEPAIRVNTEGFACPNPQCPYCRITDALVHAAFRRWQTWPGRAHPDVSRSCLPHHVQCST